MNKKQIDRVTVINKTLEMLDSNKSIRDVNLRGIAKELECAHTNLYNYFGSMEEIFWESLAEIINRMVRYLESGFKSDEAVKVEAVLERIIDFYLEHPGWYRLMWLDELKSEPSEKTKQILMLPTSGFYQVLINDGFSVEYGKKAEYMLTTYINGELSRFINKRGVAEVDDLSREKIISNVNLFYRLLRSSL